MSAPIPHTFPWNLGIPPLANVIDNGALPLSAEGLWVVRTPMHHPWAVTAEPSAGSEGHGNGTLTNRLGQPGSETSPEQ